MDTQTAPPQTLTLTLLNLSQSQSTIDAQPIQILIHNSFLLKCINLTTTKNTKQQQNCRNNILQSILRFRQQTDKLLALCSVLLKSRAYHQVVGTEPSFVVELPRTEYRKPYFPDREGELSISHQYPFVGLLLEKTPVKNWIGLDIVVMDHTKDESFLECFYEQFSRWEWSVIRNKQTRRDDNNIAIMNEFYLRWAMKEAYTKALGLGLGLEFDSFEIRVEGGGLWDDIVERGQHRVRGRVVFLKERKKEEVWDFVFLNLLGCEFPSCACVAVGKMGGGGVCDDFALDVEWMTLNELIEWHDKK